MNLTQKKYLLLISHGSREKSANLEFERIARKYQSLHPRWKVAHAYLVLVHPSIPEALERLAAKTNILFVLPFFLFSARHVKKDIPEIIKTFCQNNPELKVKLTKPLGSDSKILEILDQRVR